nr:MAG TPA: Kruppel-like factor 3 finger, kruppel-like, DNA BINDING [Caudoviricetes sp.]
MAQSQTRADRLLYCEVWHKLKCEFCDSDFSKKRGIMYMLRERRKAPALFCLTARA